MRNSKVDRTRALGGLNNGKKKSGLGERNSVGIVQFPRTVLELPAGDHQSSTGVKEPPVPPKRNKLLDQQYIPILAVHGATGLMAKLSFLAGLILVQQENLRKHSVIMTWILMVHFVVGTFTTAAAGITSMSVVAGLMVALCGASLAMENGSWRGLPNGQPWRGLAILGYIVVLWFPLWPAQGVARALFFSPMSALPHQDILAVMILCMVSGATRSRLLTWGSCAAAIIVGILELKGGSVARGVIMVTASAAFGVIPLMNFSRNAAQDLSDGIKSQRAVDPIAHDSEKPRKKWDLK